MQSILIIGGGFAGVWGAMSAVRALEELGAGPAGIRLTLVSRDAYLTIRPRLYEADLSDVRVPLDDVLGPIGVERIEGAVTAIDPARRTATVDSAGDRGILTYDRLILAAGGGLHRPALPGLEAHAFSVDTYTEAAALGRHLAELPERPAAPGRFTAVVIGAGFTGLEAVTGLADRLRAAAARAGVPGESRVVLVERADVVGPELGPRPRPVIEAALRDLGVELRLGAATTEVHADGVRLADGEWIPAATTVWTAGMRASPLTAQLPVARDALGRLPVDAVLRVRGVEDVFAAGDVAHAMASPEHASLMSCQHASPMGMHAGFNAVADLLGAEPLPYAQPDYVTCIDLGAWGALFTQGWDRQVRLTGFWAKMVKEAITTRMIYPPRSGDRREILDAAALRRPPVPA